MLNLDNPVEVSNLIVVRRRWTQEQAMKIKFWDNFL